MIPVSCPALDGRYALSFLAALGTAHLLDRAGHPAALSWSDTDSTAVISADGIEHVDELVDVLADTVAAMPEGVVVPGGPLGLPPAGEAPDKLRLPPNELRQLRADLLAAGDPSVVDAWLTSLVTDLAVDDKGRCAHTLFGAFSGKQSMYTMLTKSLNMVRHEPALLREALLHWRRVDGVTGEYLDHRVLFDAADSPLGASRERGVPGATWLALMSFPLIRTTSVDGDRPISTGWYTVRRSNRLRWPLWTTPLDLDAAVALWESALVTHIARRDDLRGAETDAFAVGVRKRGDDAEARLNAIGVFAVHRAERRRIEGRNFAGVLAPVG